MAEGSESLSKYEIKKLFDSSENADEFQPKIVNKNKKDEADELKDPYEKRHVLNPELTKELPILKIASLSKKFKGKTVLNDINLDIRKGEIFGIVGESGSGKTTLLKTLVGFILPDNGSVMFEQRDTFKNVHSTSRDAKLLFGFAAQEPSFYLKLSVQENIEHFGALYGLSKEERKQNAERLLKLVNLFDARESLAVKLSGGMRRRLGLLTATVHKPEVYVLDEPTADLDPYSRKLIIHFIRHINEQGKTVIIASHLLEDIENLCDRVGIMYNGKMTMVSTPDDLKKIYAKHKLIEVEAKPKKYDNIMKKLKDTKLKLTDMYVDNKKLYIKSEDPESLLAKLLSIIKDCNQELIDINISRPTLAEIFEDICTD